MKKNCTYVNKWSGSGQEKIGKIIAIIIAVALLNAKMTIEKEFIFKK